MRRRMKINVRWDDVFEVGVVVETWGNESRKYGYERDNVV